ncbi:lysozyme [Leadbetterella byssophila]|uniref:lysozyme n=1 Tax=Leadbetterella byssophila TaxID=316068 RepID=UPI0039A3E12D
MYALDKIGFDFIESFEKFVAKPYQDSAGIWTQGIGSTINMDTGQKVKPTDPPITYETAKRWKLAHIAKHTNPVILNLIKIQLNQNQYNALASFVYNCGGYYKSSNGKMVPYQLFDLINKRTEESKLKAYWENCAVTAGGKVLAGLQRRRKAEVNLFFTKPLTTT